MSEEITQEHVLMGYFMMYSAPPWGDYGSILQNGMTRHLSPIEERLQLERTGPFLPPVSFPGRDVLVSGDVRVALEAAGFVGVIGFKAVDKRRIVRLEWHVWDFRLPSPPLYPPESSPENYILRAPHDDATSLEIGNVWELQLLTCGAATQQVISYAPPTYRARLRRVEGAPDLFKAGLRHPFVSQRAKDWFQQFDLRFVAFEPVDVDEA